MNNARRKPRRWSLQREWSRVFTMMLLALMAGAAITIVGVRFVVHGMEDAAMRLQVEYASVAGLSEALESHEKSGYRLLAAASPERGSFSQGQAEVGRLFEAAAAAGPDDAGRLAALERARQRWQTGMEQAGLWNGAGSRPAGSQGPALLAETGADVRSQLAAVQQSSLQALDSGLVDTRAMERLISAGRLGLFVVAVGATLYFRRRMTVHLTRPLNALRHGVMKLQSGDYTHRLPVARSDELGEVTAAFNKMASALQESHTALTYRATHDELTGLGNRAALAERLAAPIDPDTSTREGLLFIDIDDFKEVNDSLGHEGGDALLVQLGHRLRDCVGADNLVVRLGGDEFAVVVADDGGTTAGTERIAGRINTALNEPFVVSGRTLWISLSMGVAQRTAETADVTELLRQADSAMYRAKLGGKARYEVHGT